MSVIADYIPPYKAQIERIVQLLGVLDDFNAQYSSKIKQIAIYSDNTIECSEFGGEPLVIRTKITDEELQSIMYVLKHHTEYDDCSLRPI